MWRQKAKDGTTQLVGGLTISGVFNAIYPVGSVIFTTDNTNPGTRYGGTTWVAFGTGRAIVGAGSNGVNSYTSEQTFGSDSHTLQPGESGVNAHTHTGGPYAGYTSGFNTNHQHDLTGDPTFYKSGSLGAAGLAGHVASGAATNRAFSTAQVSSYVSNYANTDHVHIVGGVSGATGATPHENRQASIALYAWKRTA